MKNFLQTSQVLIGMGSNLGDRKEHIEKAIEHLSHREVVCLKRASLYHSDPIGNADQSFINTAILCSTTLKPLALLRCLLDAELSLGRVRKIHWGNRCIDLDIILWENPDNSMLSFESEGLSIPHPRALERDFVMVPCAEIAPDWLFPGESTTLKKICEQKRFYLNSI